MQLDKLSITHLKKIFEIYAETFGGEFSSGYPDWLLDSIAEDLLDDLRKYAYIDRRTGSRWNPHTKLDIRVEYGGKLSFDINLNFTRDEQGEERFKESQEAQTRFRELVIEYINSQEG